ncbi:carbon-nitrogen hydrolase family protein [Labrenzia sp. OB1]|uniref:carbon-nitrogen hydrolase family protein n=1 Tax=Labrenzia sp. OB1 TaxID=1561204 RepID=UPI0007B2DBA0|nr:carbon-nitrogen hydrolase family protein [Labrenzia sp. OB1]KZM50484.1 amidohydrolase [Labrenzia sp. OB1]
MPSFIAACIQLRSGKTPSENANVAEGLIRAAAKDGAHYIQTPEMSNVLVRSREELMERISEPAEDAFLAMARPLAVELGICLHIGSLAVLAGNGKVANRAFLIGPDGQIQASYDKIHMFDVDLPNGESWRESATYEPGRRSVVADLPYARLGMAICYDIRFPAIFRTQARAGAQILTGPAAFTRQTGEAHWHVLQRARAIENGAFVISAAQGGAHEDGRETYGHSLIVDPWGTVIAEMNNDAPGHLLASIDTDEVVKARQRIPAIANERDFTCEVAQELKGETA